MREIHIPNEGDYTEIKVKKARNGQSIYLLFKGKINQETKSSFENSLIQEVLYDYLAETDIDCPFLVFTLAGELGLLANNLFKGGKYIDLSEKMILVADTITKSFCSYRNEPLSEEFIQHFAKTHWDD